MYVHVIKYRNFWNTFETAEEAFKNLEEGRSQNITTRFNIFLKNNDVSRSLELDNSFGSFIVEEYSFASINE